MMLCGFYAHIRDLPVLQAARSVGVSVDDGSRISGSRLPLMMSDWVLGFLGDGCGRCRSRICGIADYLHDLHGLVVCGTLRSSDRILHGPFYVKSEYGGVIRQQPGCWAITRNNPIMSGPY